MDVIVSKKYYETSDICILELIDPNGNDLGEFTAGSHIDVKLNNGLIKQYSICNSPIENHRYVIGVLKDPNSKGGSKYIHECISEGDVLEIGRPRNLFKLADNSNKSLLFAGGIGITPIICMAEYLSYQKKEFELHYCCKSKDKAAFLERIENSPFKNNIQLHYDDTPNTKMCLENIFSKDLMKSNIYVCGPGGFIDFVLNTAKEYGYKDSQLYREYFANKNSDKSENKDKEFEVEIYSTKQKFKIPKDKTIIEVLNIHGIDIPVSCEQGVCGTCLTGVKSGIPDHRDIFLSEEEHLRNDQITLCCSRSKTGLLVLDL